jgi:hypothetical protein
MGNIMPQPSTSQIKDFLQVITKDWVQLDCNPFIELRCINQSRGVQVSRFATQDADAAAQHAEAMNAAGQNVYMCINPVREDAQIEAGKGARDTDIAAAFYCFADADTDGAMQNILSFAGPKFTMSVKTGTTPYIRGHAYWELEEPCLNMDAWKDVQKAIAASLGTDPMVVNPSRIMRVAGTVSWPNKDKVAKGYVPELVTLRTQFSADRDPVPFERMMRAFPKRGDGGAQALPSAELFIDTGKQAMDRAMAEASVISGQDWHNNVIRLVASYVSRGLTDSEIHAITDRFTASGYTVEDTRREVQQAIDGARSKGWTPTPQVSPSEVLQSLQSPDAAPQKDAIDTGAAPIKHAPIFWANEALPVLKSAYLVKGWLGAQQMSVVYAPSNVGKSFFCLDIAYCVAASIPWQGCKVRGGPVLYLATEGGNAFRNRVYALQSEYGAENVPLAVRPSPVNLLNPEADLPALGALCNEIEQQHGKLALIVVDTLSRAIAGGNENGPEDMTAFIANVDALRDYTGAHVMIVHHTGKDTAQGARGHSSLRAATDTEIEIENDEGLRTATATKQRDLEPKQPIVFQLKVHEIGNDDDGDAVTTCTIIAADPELVEDKNIKRPNGKNQKLVTSAFKQLRGEGVGKPNPSGAGFPEPGKFWCIDEQKLREFCYGKIAAANKVSAYTGAMDGLLGSGYMVQNEGLVWIAAKEGRVV